jgi:hypothetical protein
MLDFTWILDGVDPRCDPCGTKMKHKWNFNEIKVEISWAYKCKQYFFTKVIVNNQAW